MDSPIVEEPPFDLVVNQQSSGASGKKKRRGKKKNGGGNQANSAINLATEVGQEDMSISESSPPDIANNESSQESDGSRRASQDSEIVTQADSSFDRSLFGLPADEQNVTREADVPPGPDVIGLMPENENGNGNGNENGNEAHPADWTWIGRFPPLQRESPGLSSALEDRPLTDSPILEEHQWVEGPASEFSTAGLTKNEWDNAGGNGQGFYDQIGHGIAPAAANHEAVNDLSSMEQQQQHYMESYADAVREGPVHHHEEHHILEEYSRPDIVHHHEEEHILEEYSRPDIDQQQESSVHDDRSFSREEEFPSLASQVVQNDFSRVVENTKEELQNIVGGEFIPRQQNMFGGNATYVQNIGLNNDDFVRQNVSDVSQNFDRSVENASAGLICNDENGVGAAGQACGENFQDGRPSSNLNQRRSYGFSKDASSFQQQSVHQNGNGGLDSPMAEFDADKRRQNQTSHLGQSTIRPRRSRPISQHARDLIFWRNVKDSGVIFSFGLVLLLSLSHFSIISIFAYLSMTSLILTTSFVLIKQITMAFAQQASEHPFKLVLDKEVVINPEYAHQQLDTLLKPLNNMLLQIRNLYLADSLGQTLKLIFIMYILTYIGSWFNLLTLLIIVWVAAFTVPKTYVLYKEQIDSVLQVLFEGLRDMKVQIGHGISVQVNKVKAKMSRPSTSSIGGGAAGQIRSRDDVTYEKVEAEVKTAGGKVSTKMEKKIR